MLDIISMITFLFIFIGLPMILIIIGGNDKTEEEQRLEDEEQMEYLRQYREKKLNKKRKFWRYGLSTLFCTIFIRTFFYIQLVLNNSMNYVF